MEDFRLMDYFSSMDDLSSNKLPKDDHRRRLMDAHLEDIQKEIKRVEKINRQDQLGNELLANVELRYGTPPTSPKNVFDFGEWEDITVWVDGDLVGDDDLWEGMDIVDHLDFSKLEDVIDLSSWDDIIDVEKYFEEVDRFESPKKSEDGGASEIGDSADMAPITVSELINLLFPNHNQPRVAVYEDLTDMFHEENSDLSDEGSDLSKDDDGTMSPVSV